MLSVTRIAVLILIAMVIATGAQCAVACATAPQPCPHCHQHGSAPHQHMSAVCTGRAVVAGPHMAGIAAAPVRRAAVSAAAIRVTGSSSPPAVLAGSRAVALRI